MYCHIYNRFTLGALPKNPLSSGYLRPCCVSGQGLSWYTWSWRDHQGSNMFDWKTSKGWTIFDLETLHRCALSQTIRWSSVIHGKVRQSQITPPKNKMSTWFSRNRSDQSQITKNNNKTEDTSFSGKYMAVCLLYRGDVVPKVEPQISIADLKSWRQKLKSNFRMWMQQLPRSRPIGPSSL